MAVIPSAPTTDLTLIAQVSQFGINDPYESVLPALAAPTVRALQAEVNSAAGVKNPNYVRP